MKFIVKRIIPALLILFLGLTLKSCEPPLCAYCYDTGPLGRIFDDRDIEICADDAYELDELVWLAEDMGYYCEYK